MVGRAGDEAKPSQTEGGRALLILPLLLNEEGLRTVSWPRVRAELIVAE